MDSLAWLLVSFFIALIFVLVTIIKFKMHPFLSLILGGIVMGICSGMKLTTIASTMSSGFGSTMGGIGIIILYGIILGQLLHISGATEEIAALMLRATGEKRAPLAVNLTGYIVSIPVFFDAAFVILVNLVKSLSRKGKIPFITLVTALGVGLITTHAMVIPTPGPLAVAANMGASVGAMLLYSIPVALVASLVGGVLYAKSLGRKKEYANDFANAFDDVEETVNTSRNANRPSGGMGVFLIFLPILIILIGNVAKMFVPEGFVYDLFAFLSDKNIALLIGVVVAYAALRKYLKGSFADLIADCGGQAGAIYIITGAGGAFGAIINATGIGDKLVAGMEGLTQSASAGLITVLIAFLISQVLRAAQGSTTVALITTSAIFGPLVASLGTVSPVLVGLAICAGGIGCSLPNDSGFWVVNRFSKFSVKQTMQSWTVGGTVAGVSALLVIMLLTLLQNVLPGLM